MTLNLEYIYIILNESIMKLTNICSLIDVIDDKKKCGFAIFLQKDNNVHAKLPYILLQFSKVLTSGIFIQLITLKYSKVFSEIILDD